MCTDADGSGVHQKMKGCGISGDVRVVSGVPFRLTQNRDDTSWAEEYLVEAARPLSHVGKMPRKIRGPWQPIATLIGGAEVGTRWRISHLPVLHFEGASCQLHTFNEALAELAGIWKRSVLAPAELERDLLLETDIWTQPAR